MKHRSKFDFRDVNHRILKLKVVTKVMSDRKIIKKRKETKAIDAMLDYFCSKLIGTTDPKELEQIIENEQIQG